MNIKLVNSVDVPYAIIRDVKSVPGVIEWKKRIFVFWYHFDCDTQVFKETDQHNYVDKELEIL